MRDFSRFSATVGILELLGGAAFVPVMSCSHSTENKSPQPLPLDQRLKTGEVRLRVQGEEGVMPLFTSLSQTLFTSTVQDGGWDVAYVLTPDADEVKIEYTITNRGKASVEVGLPIVAFFAGAGGPPFMPGYGFVPAGASQFAEYYANAGEDISYIYGRPEAPISVIVQD